MDGTALDDVAGRPAGEIGRRAELGAEAVAALAGRDSPGRCLDLLIGRQLWPDAVRFLAHALPKREAVWWACQCARLVAGAGLTAPAAEALRAAERWAAEPGEETRRAAQTAAEAAGLGTPAGCAALAAFLSGGSLAPAGLPEVPPAEPLTARAVAGGVLLAGVLAEPRQAPERYHRFLDLGLAVAGGANRWAAPAPAGPAPRSPSPSGPPPTRRATPPLFDTWE